MDRPDVPRPGLGRVLVFEVDASLPGHVLQRRGDQGDVDAARRLRLVVWHHAAGARAGGRRPRLACVRGCRLPDHCAPVGRSSTTSHLLASAGGLPRRLRLLVHGSCVGQTASALDHLFAQRVAIAPNLNPVHSNALARAARYLGHRIGHASGPIRAASACRMSPHRCAVAPVPDVLAPNPPEGACLWTLPRAVAADVHPGCHRRRHFHRSASRPPCPRFVIPPD